MGRDQGLELGFPMGAWRDLEMHIWHRVASLRLASFDLGQIQGFMIAVLAITLVWIVFDRFGQ